MNILFFLPNILSLLRIVLTPVFVFCFLKGYGYLAILIFTLAAITDYYDGYFARKLGLVSKYGMFLDPLADKVLVITAFITFYIFGILELWMLLIIIFRDLIITGLRIFFTLHGIILRTSALGKWKTFFQMVLIYVILVMCNFRHFAVMDNFPIILFIHAVVWLTVYSGLDYLITNLDYLKRL